MNAKKKDISILRGNGKAWSNASADIMDKFKSWMNASGITEDILKREINNDSFTVTFEKENDYAELKLKNNANIIGLPFVWRKDSEIDFCNFSVDAGLIILHIMSYAYNEKTKCELKNAVSNINCL